MTIETLVVEENAGELTQTEASKVLARTSLKAKRGPSFGLLPKGGEGVALIEKRNACLKYLLQEKIVLLSLCIPCTLCKLRETSWFGTMDCLQTGLPYANYVRPPGPGRFGDDTGGSRVGVDLASEFGGSSWRERGRDPEQARTSKEYVERWKAEAVVRGAGWQQAELRQARYRARWRRRGEKQSAVVKHGRWAYDKRRKMASEKDRENTGPERRVTVQQTRFVVNRSVESRSTQNNGEGESGPQLPSL